MSAAELDELFFDDLGLRPVGSGSLVETDADGRTIAGVVESTASRCSWRPTRPPSTAASNGCSSGCGSALPILTALVAALAWLLTSRALRPVASITDRAATISGGSLDARVPVPELPRRDLDARDHRQRDARSARGRRPGPPPFHLRRVPRAAVARLPSCATTPKSRSEHPDTTDVRRLASVVADESSRLSTIIDDLLALARHDEGVAPPTDEIDLDDIVLAEAARTRRVPVDSTERVGGTGSGSPRRAHAIGESSPRQRGPARNDIGDRCRSGPRHRSSS